MAKPITPSVIKALVERLTDFGYTVTEEFVKEQVEKVMAGQTPNIIGKFAKTMLIENGYLDREA